MSIWASSVTRNTLGLMGAGAAILLAITVLSLWLVARTQENATEIVQERGVRMAAAAILNHLLEAETGQRGFLLTRNRSYLAPFETAKGRLAVEIQTLRRAAINSPEIASDVDRLEKLTAAKVAELARTIEMQSAGRSEEALAIVNSEEGRKTMDEARVVLGGIIERAENRVGGSLDTMEGAAKTLAWTTSLGGLAIVMFSALAIYIVADYTTSLVAARGEVMSLNENLEERVTERTTALARANDEIQRFAYIVSHDLRAPLVNIMGFTSEMEVGAGALKTYFSAENASEDEAAAAQRAAEEEIPEALHFIRASTSKMDGLIGAILKLSREGRRELKRERVDLDALMANASSSLQHQLESAGARLDIPERLPSVVADRLALEQVFGNILDNAVKYLAKDRAGLIEINGEESGGRVKITIKDNGRGIEERDRERIFELFRRAGAQDRPGEGVGLAHVRALVRRMGGDVTVQSEFGRGTTFQVDLPKKTKVRDNAEAL